MQTVSSSRDRPDGSPVANILTIDGTTTLEKYWNILLRSLVMISLGARDG